MKRLERAISTAIPTIECRVVHTSTALGAIKPETVNGTTRESCRGRAGEGGVDVGVRAHGGGGFAVRVGRLVLGYLGIFVMMVIGNADVCVHVCLRGEYDGFVRI